MKIAIITDTHFGASNDNLNFNDYFYKFYDDIFFPMLKERDITTCIHMGDVVDRRKYISYRIANDFRSRFIERFKELNIDLHIITQSYLMPKDMIPCFLLFVIFRLEIGVSRKNFTDKVTLF